MKKAYKKAIQIILALIVICVLGFIVFTIWIFIPPSWYTPAPKTCAELLPTEEELQQRKEKKAKIDTSEWHTYTNEEHGFQVQYPSNWEIEEESEKAPHYGKKQLFSVEFQSDDYKAPGYARVSLNRATFNLKDPNMREILQENKKCNTRAIPQLIANNEELTSLWSCLSFGGPHLLYKEYALHSSQHNMQDYFGLSITYHDETLSSVAGYDWSTDTDQNRIRYPKGCEDRIDLTTAERILESFTLTD